MTESPTIAFDVLPGNGGPGRYVSALARGLAADGWNVIYPLAMQSAAANTNPQQQSAPPPRQLRRALARCLPRCVRYVAGFASHTRQIARRIAGQPIDLFHAQNTGCEEMPIGCRWGGVRRVLGTFHVDSTTDLERSRNRLVHRSLEWVSNRCLHQAIAVSEATKRNWVERTHLRSEQVTVIHNGIDPQVICRRQSPLASRQGLGLPPSGLIIGGMGRLDRVKGFSHLIEALAILRPEFPELYLAIAGTGPLADQLAQEAAARGIADRVVLLGFCRDVNLFLDALDVFVLSSLAEALPFALLEAMGHALPVVGTQVGGVPEVVVPEATGRLVPPRDSVALAAAIGPLLHGSELRQRFGRAGYERVGRHFREADMVQKTLKIYRQMLNQGATLCP